MVIDIKLIQNPNPTPDIDEEQLQSIVDSVEEKGLSHAIVVRPANDLGYILCSGEKRLMAFQRLNSKHPTDPRWIGIEATVKDIDEHEGQEIRLHENLKRFNLAWYDEVAMKEQLHLLRQAQHGAAVRTGRPSEADIVAPKKVGWSIRDTAKELGVGVGNLSEDLSLARALQRDPTLKKVQDKKTAIKLARIILTRHTTEQEASMPTKFDANQVLLGDSAEILAKLPKDTFDAVITDPPWIKFFEPSLRLDARTVPVLKQVFRVMKWNAFLYLVCGLDDYAYYVGTDRPNPDAPTETIHERGILEIMGFTVANTPIIWHKGNALSRRGVRQWEYDRDFEFIIVAVKGNPALTTSRRLSGIKEFNIVHPAHMIHPNEKPVDLIKEIIEDCTYEKNVILDPFGGSGVLAEACIAMRRRYYVIERDKKSYDLIVRRIKDL